MYNEKAKERTMRYMREKRENLNVNLPLGTKARYKAYAESQGKSLTALIIELLEREIEDNGGENTQSPPGQSR